MYNEKLNEILNELNGLFDNINKKEELEKLKNEYLGKNGKITASVNDKINNLQTQITVNKNGLSPVARTTTSGFSCLIKRQNLSKTSFSGPEKSLNPHSFAIGAKNSSEL